MTRAILAAFAFVLAFAGCDGRPSSSWLSQPQFAVGAWDVHHQPDLAAHELGWIRQTIALHIAISERTIPTNRAVGCARWVSRFPHTRPKIYVYDRKVKALNSPTHIGVTAYADMRREQVHCVLGRKVSMPGLAAAVHQLRTGPDPWHQDAALGWSVLFPAQAQLEAYTVATR